MVKFLGMFQVPLGQFSDDSSSFRETLAGVMLVLLIHVACIPSTLD